jgi:hypothetical protein
MAGRGLELQKAIFAALSQDAALTALTDGPRVFDRVPANTPFPYVTFGRTSLYDWSTGTESGVEQLFSLHVWSKAQGKAETLAILERIAALLDDRPLPLEGAALVSMRIEFSEVRYDDDLAVHHGLARLRALVETTG